MCVVASCNLFCFFSSIWNGFIDQKFQEQYCQSKKLHCPNVCTIHNNSKIIIEKNAILCEQAHSKIQNFCLFHCSCASALFCTSLFKDGGHACSCTTQIGHLLRSGSDSPQPGRGGLGQESNTGPDCFQAICTFTLFISDHLSWISVFLFFKCTVFASKISLTFFLMFLADYYCSVFFFSLIYHLIKMTAERWQERGWKRERMTLVKGHMLNLNPVLLKDCRHLYLCIVWLLTTYWCHTSCMP